MPKTAALAYRAQSGGGSVNDLKALIASVPVPQDVLKAVGAELTADFTASDANSATRTVTATFAAITPATIGAPVINGAGQIVSVPVTSPGSGYTALPVLTIQSAAEPVARGRLRASLTVLDSTIVAPGVGNTGPLVFFQGGLAPPQIDKTTGFFPESCLQGITIVDSGRNYTSNAVLQFSATLAAGGRMPAGTAVFSSLGEVLAVVLTDAGKGIISAVQAVIWDPGISNNGSGGGTGAIFSTRLGVGEAAAATATESLGAVTTVTITNPGGPYVALPTMVITDPTGSGAVVTPTMGLLGIEVVNPGQGYSGSPTVTAEDLFFSIFRTADSWTSPFENLMTSSLQRAVMSPVTAVPVVLS